jgi:hypothetical protein
MITRLGEPSPRRQTTALGLIPSGIHALAAGPLVRSRDGRLQAFAVPETAWCGDVVGIRLEGAPRLLVREPAFVRKFLAGVRAAVVAEFRRAKGIRLHAQEGERVGFRACSSKDLGWAISVMPAADHSPAGSPVLKLDDSARRTIAKIDAVSLDEMAGARRAMFLNRAEAGTANTAWRLSNVSIGLTIRETTLLNVIPLKSIVDTISGRVVKGCSKVDGAELGGKEGKVVRRTFICRQPPNSYGYGLIAYQPVDEVASDRIRFQVRFG